MHICENFQKNNERAKDAQNLTLLTCPYTTLRVEQTSSTSHWRLEGNLTYMSMETQHIIL